MSITKGMLLLGTMVIPTVAVAQSGVIINRKELSAKEMNTLKSRVGFVAPGKYWYDSRNGAWGYEGGPAAGVIPPQMAVGGKLRADASGGHSRVYVNGRALHPSEITLLQNMVGVVYEGQYWMDANGNYGVVNGAYLGNLYALAAQAAQRAQYYRQTPATWGGRNGGNSFWTSDATGSHVSSNASGDFIITGEGFNFSNF